MDLRKSKKLLMSLYC